MKSIRFLPTRHFHRSSWPLLCLSVLLAPIAPGLGPVGPVNADGANTAENTAAETTKNAPAAEPKSSKSPNQPPPNATPREIEQGKKAAADLEPKIKLIDGSKNPKDKALLDKLNKIAGELGKASLRPGIKYTVKLIEDKDLNAFTLPNGYVYMYRGLVEFAGSDDELAAVLAHEIGHNAMMHAMRGERKQKSLNWAAIAAMLGIMAGGRSGADVAQFTQYLLVGIMNGYGENFEKEADRAAIAELAQTSYNPSALVTFMQRLSQEEKRRPDIGELGIFRTHPPSEARASAAMTTILNLGLKFTPRAVAGAHEATVAETKDRVTVKLGDVTLLEFALQPPGNAKQRAEQAAQQINQLLRANLLMHEIQADGDASGARLTARGEEVARITLEDAKLQNLTPLTVAQKWRDSFRRVFWREAVRGKL
ncbi:MAG: M48 family metalloprotease [Armatimonadota bacterium]|nr:M48 family metalloprotease [Armatimonadota bacterium]